MKTPIAQSKHDLHECYGKRIVSTIAYNLPYRIARHKKKLLNIINYLNGKIVISISSNCGVMSIDLYLQKYSMRLLIYLLNQLMMHY